MFCHVGMENGTDDDFSALLAHLRRKVLQNIAAAFLVGQDSKRRSTVMLLEHAHIVVHYCSGGARVNLKQIGVAPVCGV